MLLVVKEVKGARTVVTEIQDDSAVAQAVDLATGILRHNKKHIKRMLVFITRGKGSQPLLIQKVGMNWRGRIIVS